MSPSPAFALTNVQCTFGGQVALDVERLVIARGTTAIVGPNGSGKTTLLRVLATVSGPTSGDVRIDGADPAEPAALPAIRRRLGFAPQNDRLPARMRVGEFCNYIAALREIGPRRRRLRWVEWVLSDAGLTDQRNDRIGSLSGGMRRRLLIAQARLGRPDAVILDEPLASLDAEFRSTTVRAIAGSADDRTTVVATHHVDELASVCRSVVVLVGGRIRFVGEPGQLAERARGRTFETSTPMDVPGVRAMGPDRFRMVDVEPPGSVAVEPTPQDGYVAVVADAEVGSP